MHWLAAVLAGWLAVSCGGGGGGGTTAGRGASGSGAENACGSGALLTTFFYQDPLTGQVGTSLSSLPETSGVPAACVDARRFALASGTLPPGLTLDARTGLIAGTPSASGQFLFEVRLTVDGLTGSATATNIAVVDAISGFSFGAWEQRGGNTPFLDDFRIATLGGKLYVVSRGFYTHAVETYESTDGGASWTLLATPGPAGDLRQFALAWDAAAIYLSGGSDGTSLNSGVWRFDGTAWTRVTAAGAFPARDRHAMASHAGALYILGGTAGTTIFDDTWKSTDGGATWTRVSAAGYTRRWNACAVSHGGYLYAIGGNAIGLRNFAGSTVTNVLFRTADGSTWTDVPVSASSPLLTTLDTGSGACAVLNGRILYVGDGGNLPGNASRTVSSPDGTNWSYEPHHALGLAGLSPGAAALAGRVYVTSGSGTSQRYVMRTVP